MLPKVIPAIFPFVYQERALIQLQANSGIYQPWTSFIELFGLGFQFEQMWQRRSSHVSIVGVAPHE